MMTVDIVIATYNRADRASRTVQQFLDLNDKFFERIIIVDSTDGLSADDYPRAEPIRYLRSSHKNQPYQRFLGFLSSKSDILLYLDDDLDLIDLGQLCEGLLEFGNPDVKGVGFTSLGGNEFVESAPKSIFAGNSGKILRGIRSISGNPQVAPGKFWLCGLRGARVDNFPVEFVGGAHGFAFLRRSTFINFNFVLFDIFEEKSGMGEDVIFGFTVSRQGKIIQKNSAVFFHDDQKSSAYSPNYFLYNKNVAFSRLYCSLEYARFEGMHDIVARLHFHWYVLWRFVGKVTSFCINPSRKRWDCLQGWLSGWKKAFFWKPREFNEAAIFWRAEGKRDLYYE